MKKQLAIINREKLTGNISLQEAIASNTEALEDLHLSLEKKKEEYCELREKLKLAGEIGMRTQGLKNSSTRLLNHIDQIADMIVAYESGFLEIPDLDRHAADLETGENEFWGISLNAHVPLRVFRAVKKAKDAGCFDRIVIYDDRAGDPIIAGVIGDRRFLISSYR